MERGTRDAVFKMEHLRGRLDQTNTKTRAAALRRQARQTARPITRSRQAERLADLQLDEFSTDEFVHSTGKLGYIEVTGQVQLFSGCHLYELS